MLVIQSKKLSFQLSSEKNNSFLSVNNLTTINNNLLFTEQTLSFFDNIEIKLGTCFKVNQTNQSVEILRDCAIKIQGDINCEYPNTKTFEIFLAKNGVSFELGKIGTGNGTGRPVNLTSSVSFQAHKGDIFTLKAKAISATDILKILSCSVSIETIN
jgi:hypothetical protein